MKNLSPSLPELLAPAGNLEKLKVACLYGADAVYTGATRFSLRSGADNLTRQELIEGLAFAKKHGVKVYIALNAFLHDQDFEGLPESVQEFEALGVDAFIVSDLGVIQVIRNHCQVPVHLSTQASCVNHASAKVWTSLGAKRIIVGRELSIEESAQIKEQNQCEVEMFIHGAMCSAYSGHCTISNYTAGRDSNRGGCKQSCRFRYEIPGQEQSLTLMSSKDLNGLQYLNHFIEQGIDSIKIEGRMKSNLYLAATCKAYRHALDQVKNKRSADLTLSKKLLESYPHRGYTEASLDHPADELSIYQAPTSIEPESKNAFLGTVLSPTDNGALIQLKNPIGTDTQAQLLSFRQEDPIVHIQDIRNINGEKLEKASQDQTVYLPQFENAMPGMILKLAQP